MTAGEVSFCPVELSGAGPPLSVTASIVQLRSPTLSDGSIREQQRTFTREGQGQITWVRSKGENRLNNVLFPIYLIKLLFT